MSPNPDGTPLGSAAANDPLWWAQDPGEVAARPRLGCMTEPRRGSRRIAGGLGACTGLEPIPQDPSCDRLARLFLDGNFRMKDVSIKEFRVLSLRFQAVVENARSW